jgi:hypothetical protein
MYVQIVTTSLFKLRKKGKTNCFGKVLLLLGTAARWHSTTVEKGGRERGGAGSRPDREYSTHLHMEQLGDTHGNNMFDVCESVNNVNRLMHSMRVKSVNCHVENVDENHDKIDKYSNVHVRCSYQACWQSGINHFELSEYSNWVRKDFAEFSHCEVCQSSRLCIADFTCCSGERPTYCDSSESTKDMQPKFTVTWDPAASNVIYAESPLQLQSIHKIGLSRYCGAERSRRIGKGFKPDKCL